MIWMFCYLFTLETEICKLYFSSDISIIISLFTFKGNYRLLLVSNRSIPWSDKKKLKRNSKVKLQGQP